MSTIDSETWYKLARPDGWDFYTGKTINYREAAHNGSVVHHPDPHPERGLCSDGILHGSPMAEMCFLGAKLPCSLYSFEGTPVVPFDGTKAGFIEMHNLQELDPVQHFKWRYSEACHLLMPLRGSSIQPTQHDIELLHRFASVRASVGDSVWAYMGWIFAPVVPEWKYVSHRRGRYPFMSGVRLWRRGLVPSYDGTTWRLHSGKDATVVWESTL